MKSHPTTSAVEALREIVEQIDLHRDTFIVCPYCSRQQQWFEGSDLELLTQKPVEAAKLAIAALEQGEGEKVDPAELPRCDKLDGSTLRIVPSYTEAGRFCEANCLTITDGERTAIYVPSRALEQGEAKSPRNRCGGEGEDDPGADTRGFAERYRASLPAPGASWTEEQLERAARAICTKNGDNPDEPARYSDDPAVTLMWHYWRPHAEAALSAASLNATPGAPTETLEAVQAALERDRSHVAEAFTAIKKALASRSWMTEGRGPYAYNDDRYQAEFGDALREIEAAASPLAGIAADWSNCPKTPEDIQRARSTPPAQARVGDVGAGWRLLPVKHDAEGVTRPGVTNEMVDAFWLAWKVAENKGRGHYESTYAAWNAAADAAPAHPEAAEMPGMDELLAIIDEHIPEVAADKILALLSPSAKES